MHTHSLSDWTHEHVFNKGNDAAERGTRLVVWITSAMMIIIVAAVGLVVNIVCATILGKADSHHDEHGVDGHKHIHKDLNLKSAYVHVIADAATSVLAIVALAGGWLYGWSWLDPTMGIVGALLVAVWAKNLIAQTGKVLLDREMDHPVVGEIREALETDPQAGDTRVTDLHVWRVGKALLRVRCEHCHP